MHWAYFFKLCAGLFAVLNPLGAVPVFISITEHRPAAERNRIARIAALTVGCVLLVSAFAGETILNFFGISLASFRVAGGLLLLLMAISMLHAQRSSAKQSHEESIEASERPDVAVVPLGMPLLAGPGSISTAIVYRANANTWSEYFALIGIIILLTTIVFLILRYGSRMVVQLGTTRLNIFTRVMGLILAAIAVEFITDGLTLLFPILGRT